MANVAEGRVTSNAITVSSSPIEIPILKHDHRDAHAKGSSHTAQSGHMLNHSSDEEHRLPDGSPSFAVVMNELSSSLTHTTIRRDVEIPISPLALSDDHDPYNVFTSDNDTPDKQSSSEEASPQATKKKLDPSHVTPRDRSHSWNYRNKMAAERRKQMKLTIPQHLETSSAHSSPIVLRKPKLVKSQPGTPHMLHLIPKFKILNENISVSHEDLIKEQDRERQLADDFHEAKSIFDAPNFDRLGATPE